MSDKETDEPGSPPKITTGQRIAVAAAMPISFVAQALLRHLSRGWSPTAVLIIAGFFLALFVILGLCARPYLRKRMTAVQRTPKRNAFSWAMVKDEWQKSLIVIILVPITLLATGMTVAGLVLEDYVPAFARLVAWLTPAVGLLLIVVFSTAATFLVAALSGPRLIRLITGRMPMGIKQRAARR
jgi:hypothetical protein